MNDAQTEDQSMCLSDCIEKLYEIREDMSAEELMGAWILISVNEWDQEQALQPLLATAPALLLILLLLIVLLLLLFLLVPMAFYYCFFFLDINHYLACGGSHASLPAMTALYVA